MTRWNSWTDGQSPDEKQHAARSSDPSGRPRDAAPPVPASTDQGMRAMTFTAAEQAAMQRALVLAATPGVPHGPNPRVGCVLLDASGTEVGEGFHRGAGTPHAEVDALAAAGDDRPRRDRGRDPGALRPHRAYRSLHRGAARQPGWSAWSTRSPTATRRRGVAPPRCATPGSTSRAGCWRRRRAGSTGPGLRPRARPAVRHLEVRHHPGRPQRGRRRQQPLGLQPGREARHPPAAGRVRRDAGRHRDGRGRRPAS